MVVQRGEQVRGTCAREDASHKQALPSLLTYTHTHQQQQRHHQPQRGSSHHASTPASIGTQASLPTSANHARSVHGKRKTSHQTTRATIGGPPGIRALRGRVPRAATCNTFLNAQGKVRASCMYVSDRALALILCSVTPHFTPLKTRR
jgi:hypothetical protein